MEGGGGGEGGWIEKDGLMWLGTCMMQGEAADGRKEEEEAKRKKEDARRWADHGSHHDYDDEIADLTDKFEKLLSKVDAMNEKVTTVSRQSSMLCNLDTRLQSCEREMSLRPKHKGKR